MTQYEVRWVGYDAKHNTYEPLAHLASCEDMIAEYQQQKRQRDAELEATEREKKRQKQEEAEEERQRKAAAEAAARVAAQGGGQGADGATVAGDAGTDESAPLATRIKKPETGEMVHKSAALAFLQRQALDATPGAGRGRYARSTHQPVVR